MMKKTANSQYIAEHLDNLKPGDYIELTRVYHAKSSWSGMGWPIDDNRPVTSVVARIEGDRIYGYDPHWGSPDKARDVTDRYLGRSRT